MSDTTSTEAIRAMMIDLGVGTAATEVILVVCARQDVADARMETIEQSQAGVMRLSRNNAVLNVDHAAHLIRAGHTCERGEQNLRELITLMRKHHPEIEEPDLSPAHAPEQPVARWMTDEELAVWQEDSGWVCLVGHKCGFMDDNRFANNSLNDECLWHDCTTPRPKPTQAPLETQVIEARQRHDTREAVRETVAGAAVDMAFHESEPGVNMRGVWDLKCTARWWCAIGCKEESNHSRLPECQDCGLLRPTMAEGAEDRTPPSTDPQPQPEDAPFDAWATREKDAAFNALLCRIVDAAYETDDMKRSGLLADAVRAVLDADPALRKALRGLGILRFEVSACHLEITTLKAEAARLTTKRETCGARDRNGEGICTLRPHDENVGHMDRRQREIDGLRADVTRLTETTPATPNETAGMRDGGKPAPPPPTHRPVRDPDGERGREASITGADPEAVPDAPLTLKRPTSAAQAWVDHATRLRTMVEERDARIEQLGRCITGNLEEANRLHDALEEDLAAERKRREEAEERLGVEARFAGEKETELAAIRETDSSETTDLIAHRDRLLGELGEAREEIEKFADLEMGRDKAANEAIDEVIADLAATQATATEQAQEIERLETEAVAKGPSKNLAAEVVRLRQRLDESLENIGDAVAARNSAEQREREMESERDDAVAAKEEAERERDGFETAMNKVTEQRDLANEDTERADEAEKKLITLLGWVYLDNGETVEMAGVEQAHARALETIVGREKERVEVVRVNAKVIAERDQERVWAEALEAQVREAAKANPDCYGPPCPTADPDNGLKPCPPCFVSALAPTPPAEELDAEQESDGRTFAPAQREGGAGPWRRRAGAEHEEPAAEPERCALSDCQIRVPRGGDICELSDCRLRTHPSAQHDRESVGTPWHHDCDEAGGESWIEYQDECSNDCGATRPTDTEESDHG